MGVYYPSKQSETLVSEGAHIMLPCQSSKKNVISKETPITTSLCSVAASTSSDKIKKSVRARVVTFYRLSGGG
jgi:hypothetical protein